MALKLRVISDHYKQLGKNSSRLFGVTGGRIGRSPDNDWVLPDRERYVSSHHCRILFRSGQWVLEDTSTNGVFINGSDTPASVEGLHTLQDGDRLRLGDYEVLVSIDERNDFPPDASGQIPIPSRVRHTPAHTEDLGEELDLADLLGGSAIQAAQEPRPARRIRSREGARTRSAAPCGAARGAVHTQDVETGSESRSASSPRRIQIAAGQSHRRGRGAARRHAWTGRRLADADATLRSQDAHCADLARGLSAPGQA
jgi:type VI secretion system FHA domain protein